MVAESLDDHTHLLLLDQVIDVAEALGVVGGQCLFEQQPAGGGLERVSRPAVDRRATQRDDRMQVQRALVERTQHFPRVTEHATGAGRVIHDLAEVVATDDEVLGRRHDRTTRCGRQDVVGAEHEDAGLGLCLGGQRHVNGHLVAVEVGVEARGRPSG